jgi:membrane associated rhomboid family serine protease
MEISLTLILVGITGITSWIGFQNAEFRGKWIHNAYAAYHRKEYYRLLTSGFIHADFFHLLFNMWALYLFGGVVEQYFAYLFGGKAIVYFLLLYVLGIVIASLPDFFQKKDNIHFNSLGASGGVSSIVFCAIILNPLMELIIFPIPIPMPAYIFAVLYTAYSIFMQKRQMDNVNHLAHLWGAVWGVVFILIAQPSSVLNFIDQIQSSF